MKYFAMLVITIMLCACGDSLSLEQRNIKVQFEQLVQMTKENLPLSINEYIALTNVEQIEKGLTIKFTYEVAEYNLEDTLDIDELAIALTQENCNNDVFAPLFKDGAQVLITYETLEKEEISTLRFNAETCKK